MKHHLENLVLQAIAQLQGDGSLGKDITLRSEEHTSELQSH